jgi:hypothetical protein
VKLAPGTLGGDRDYRDSGSNFFGWIFGGPRTEMAPPPPARARSHSRYYNERRTTNERGFFWR